MRAEYDKKNKKTSITMTEEDFVVIERNARLKGMRVSPYMVQCALHHDETLTTEIRAKMQTIMNYAIACVRQYDLTAAEYIHKEAMKIWSL
jgi:hypothetical protein